MNKNVLASCVMLVAAAFEVGGDALIRAGLRGRGAWVVALGFAVLGSYGIIVNLLPMDFSRLLGTYVGFFAIVSILCGRLIFHEVISRSTWVGLAVILVGSLIIQVGQSRQQ
jgi:drug/metabolite transporter superfamily protein YnfA